LLRRNALASRLRSVSLLSEPRRPTRLQPSFDYQLDSCAPSPRDFFSA
jgi:hypothetical protein